MQETREAIRARLLHDANVQRAIQMRAYEIWQLRGRYDGRSKEDWMLAENEVLSFLTEQEMKKADTDAATQKPVIAEVEVVEEVVVAQPVVITNAVDETPIAVVAEIQAAVAAETGIEETPVPAEIPEMGIVLKPAKRATKKAAASNAPKGSKFAAKKEAVPKKTASRKKAATAEFEPPAQAVAVESQPEAPSEKETAPKKAASKLTTTPKTTTKKTTRKSAKTEQPSAK